MSITDERLFLSIVTLTSVHGSRAYLIAQLDLLTMAVLWLLVTKRWDIPSKYIVGPNSRESARLFKAYIRDIDWAEYRPPSPAEVDLIIENGALLYLS